MSQATETRASAPPNGQAHGRSDESRARTYWWTLRQQVEVALRHLLQRREENEGNLTFWECERLKAETDLLRAQTADVRAITAQRQQTPTQQPVAPVPVVQPATQPQTNNLSWLIAVVAIWAIIAVMVMAILANRQAPPVVAPAQNVGLVSDLDEVSEMIAPANVSELLVVERVRVDGSRERYVMYMPDPNTRALNRATDRVSFKVAPGWVITALTDAGLRTYRAGEEGEVRMVYDAIRAYRVAD
ncbi:MAG: hypothetical protein C4584_00625 [Armatimonadetes bacterium]|nr:MAG: hypothetical protein C4584_00625 [Armatimonadota bacterium]